MVFYRELYAESTQHVTGKTIQLTGSWTPIDADVNTVIGNRFQRCASACATSSATPDPRPRVISLDGISSPTERCKNRWDCSPLSGVA
jgi:hypothetical protein